MKKCLFNLFISFNLFQRWIFERIKGNRKMRFGVYSRIRKKSEDEITIIESVSNCSADRTKNYLHLCTIGRQYSWGQN